MTTEEYVARWESFKTFKQRMSSGPAPSEFHLVTTGHLMASECAELKLGPPMGCAHCDGFVDLIYNHPPVAWPWKAKDNVSTVWGKDVTVICPCCSFAHCTHRERAA